VSARWLALAFVACAPRRTPEPQRTELTVLTWNLYFRAHDQPGVEEVLAEVDPEVVFLQETTAAWQARLGGRFPYEQWVNGPEEGGGVALLSKYPLDSLTVHQVQGARFPAQRAEIQTPLGPIEVLNLHLIPPFGPRGSLITGFVRTTKPR
jgi:endonuclease/exonuclease/phosphatase family metal-dependent hydrolase